MLASVHPPDSQSLREEGPFPVVRHETWLDESCLVIDEENESHFINVDPDEGAALRMLIAHAQEMGYEPLDPEEDEGCVEFQDDDTMTIHLAKVGG